MLQLKFSSFQRLIPQLRVLNATAEFFKVRIYYFIIDVLFKEFFIGVLAVLGNMEGLHAKENQGKLGNFRIELSYFKRWYLKTQRRQATDQI